MIHNTSSHIIGNRAISNFYQVLCQYIFFVKFRLKFYKKGKDKIKLIVVAFENNCFFFFFIDKN